MGRTARAVAGGIVSAALLVVSLVSGIVAVVGALPPVDLLGPGDPVAARAEVLDVDDEFGVVWLDVRFTTEDGEVVVAWVDWYQDAPGVGDEVPVLYERDDPELVWDGIEYADSLDTIVEEVPDETAGTADDGASDEGDGRSASGVAAWVAVAAFVAAAVVAGLTVAWAARAPRRTPEGHGPPPAYPVPHAAPYPPPPYPGPYPPPSYPGPYLPPYPPPYLPPPPGPHGLPPGPPPGTPLPGPTDPGAPPTPQGWRRPG